MYAWYSSKIVVARIYILETFQQQQQQKLNWLREARRDEKRRRKKGPGWQDIKDGRTDRLTGFSADVELS